MKGLPPDVDLTPLVAAELVQVCVGATQVQLKFSNGARVSVESTIVVAGPDRETRIEDYRHGASLLISLIGARVVRAARAGDGGVLVRLEGAREVRVVNDSTAFESLQITIGERTYVG